MTSFLELIDDALGTHFHAPVYDKKKGRKKMVALIDKAAKERTDGKTPRIRSWATGNNKSVSFSPTLNGNPVLIAGKETNYVHEDHFQDFLTRLKAAVEKGELDNEIEAALEGNGAVAPETTASTGGSRNPLSNVRSSISRSLSNGKSLEQAEATARANPKFDTVHVDEVVAEFKAKAAQA